MTDKMQSEKQVETQPESGNAKDGDAQIIAYRKTCDAEGTGLSHYILMDKRTAR